MKYFALIAVMALAACSTTLKSDIAAVEVGLSAANTVATAYVSQPFCSKAPKTKLCSDPKVIAQIGVASSAAYLSVKAAESAQSADTIAAAKNAVAALTLITNTLTVGK